MSPAKTRLVSLDTYRGFVMFLMAAELLHLAAVAKQFPQSAIWRTIAFHTQHVAWTGCSLHDLIQPSFSFMVGVALPFSIAARLAQGQSRGRMWLHAILRSVILVMLGVLLRSRHHPMIYWTFEDTLSQIGLGYPFLFALGFAGPKTRWGALAVVLLGYWLFFALHPLPPPNPDRSAIGVPANWEHDFTGFAAHWDLNTNAAWSFDRWFLNLFPREMPFKGNKGGYATLSFIPTLGTMILGLLGGQWLKDTPPEHAAREKTTTRLLIAAIACVALGWFWHASGLCPSVKKIWTPSWTLFSGGWCFLFMAAFYWIMDVQGWQRWGYPLIVIGANSIAMYVLVHTVTDSMVETLPLWFGKAPFLALGKEMQPMVLGAVVLLLLWSVLWWMYRRRLFLRV